MKTYLFRSKRLGFRNWTDSDVPKLAKINTSKEVMKFFPSTLSDAETQEFIIRMRKHYLEHSYCYFAVDRLKDNAFIGFIGLLTQNYKSSFTPCVDIGWRLSNDYWNQGYATEGALRCLDYGFNTLQLKLIKSVCPCINKPSENVMKKLGMEKITTFRHPLIPEYSLLQECVLYELKQGNFQPNSINNF